MPTLNPAGDVSDVEVDVDVVIVGAGPVGQLLACELVLGGASVRVIERDLQHSDTIKAGSINLASAEILARRGLIDALRPAHERAVESIAALFAGPEQSGHEAALARARRQAPRAGHFAGLLLDADLIDGDDPDIASHTDALGATLVSQQEVEQLLDEHCDRLGVDVRRGLTVTSVREGRESVEVLTDDGPVLARWVVGCDGGRSLVRHAAGIDFVGTEPEITGRQAVVELEPGDEQRLSPGWNWSTRGVYRYGPRPGVVLTVEFDGPPADRERPVTVEEVQASLRRTSGTDVTVLALDGQATRWTDNARQATTYRAGRMLLAGDAAHVHPPFSGQGLNLGLGDAANLGWKLAATVAGWAPDGLLDTYSDERHPVGAWVLEWTRAQVALMRPEEKTGRLRDVVADLMRTPDGMTHFVALISGITQRVDLPAGHELVGRLVPDIRTRSGASLRDRFAPGRFVVLDGTADQRVIAATADWGGRVERVGAEAFDGRPLALVARPDGVVVWASDDERLQAGEARAALSRWAGRAAHEGSPT